MTFGLEYEVIRMGALLSARRVKDERSFAFGGCANQYGVLCVCLLVVNQIDCLITETYKKRRRHVIRIRSI